MKKIQNRNHLNKYNQFIQGDNEIIIAPIVPPNSPVPIPIEVNQPIEDVNENSNIVQETIEATKEESMMTIEELFPDKAEEKLPKFSDLNKKELPTLKMVVEKILLEKRLQKINGYFIK